MLTLSIDSPDKIRTVVQVTDFPCRVGRRKSSGIVLASWRVAASHAEIRRSGDVFTIVDQGSLGGTWVNGDRIVEFGPLTLDDEVMISGFTLRLIDTGQAAGQIAGQGAVGDTAVENASGQRGRPESPGRPVGLEIRRRLHGQLLTRMDLRRQEIRHLNPEQLKQKVTEHLNALINEQPDLRSCESIASLRQQVVDEAVGLGVLEPLLRRADITEIMVNGTAPVFIGTGGRLEQTNLRFSSTEAIGAVIERIVSPLGRRIDDASPMVDARLPDGSRVNAIVPPLAVRGPAITFRRSNACQFTAADLIDNGSASQPMMAFLTWCVRHRRNIVVSGGTGSGKTTLLNVLSSQFHTDERIITIEDAAELRLDHPHLVSLEARPANSEDRGLVSIRDLVRNALRMRPDRIVVGECRGGEALDMLQAMNTGHDGSLTTVHANSARDALARLEVMVLMSGVEIPVIAGREQVSSAIDIIVQQQRARDGSRRITEIVEVGGMDGAVIQSQPLFRYDKHQSRFVSCGNVPAFAESLEESHAAQLRRLVAQGMADD